MSTTATSAPNAPNAPVTSVTITHPATVSASDILTLINSAVDQETPVIVQTLQPVTPVSAQTQAYIGLGELGLGVVTAIFNGIAALKSKNAGA